MNPPAATWYCIRLPRQEVDGGELHLIQEVFRESYIARNGPRGAALYGVRDDDEDSYRLYFTPEAGLCAKALFEAYSAEPCDPPPMRNLNWICGDESRSAGYGVEF